MQVPKVKRDRAAKKRERAKLDKAWAEAVKERDGWTCQFCGYNATARGLHAHHIFSKGGHPAVRHDVSNGITLCLRHHLYFAHRDPSAFTLWLIGRMGKRKLDALERRANGTTKQVPPGTSG